MRGVAGRRAFSFYRWSHAYISDYWISRVCQQSKHKVCQYL